MSSNHSDIQSLTIYKLFFDDIEEIFLNTLSVRLLSILTLITGVFLIGILILLLSRSENLFSTSLPPFIYALIFYDFVQLFSLILLKYNFTEQFFNQLCRWPYYLKSVSESGQCLTIIFLFSLCRHQIRYFLTHSHLPNSGRIHSRALTFVCLLFIVYINNWITHLKVEKLHLVTLNQTKSEINIEELPLSFYDTSDGKTPSHQRFIADLDKYSRSYEKNFMIENSSKLTTDKIFHNRKDGSITIKFQSGLFSSSLNNRTKRQHSSKGTLNNHSYRIPRCTYGQSNFFLANFLSLIHSFAYLILMIYYLTSTSTCHFSIMTVEEHQHLYERSLSIGRRKSAERHKQLMLFMQLKQFLYFMTFSYSILTLLHLIYISLLTILLCFVQTPFVWSPLKTFFYSLFLIGYFSIPLRMGVLFIYLFLNQFSIHLQSIIFYLFHTKLRFSCKLQKPTIRFRLQFVPHTKTSSTEEYLTNSLVDAATSSIDEYTSNVVAHDSIVVYDETSRVQNYTTTNLLPDALVITNEFTSGDSRVAKL